MAQSAFGRGFFGGYFRLIRRLLPRESAVPGLIYSKTNEELKRILNVFDYNYLNTIYNDVFEQVDKQVISKHVA